MVPVTVIKRGGDAELISATVGQSLMEALRDGGIGEILAICGGCCSCGTCHVYIDDGYWEKLTPIGASEDDLLDCSSHRSGRSRLSCQIAVTEELSGITVTVAPED